MDTKNYNGRLEIELPSLLDLPAASELREILLEALAREAETSVVLKAAAVERAATAAVQVLLAAAEAFAGASRRFDIDTPSEPLAAAFRHLGLTADFDKLVVS